MISGNLLFERGGFTDPDEFVNTEIVRVDVSESMKRQERKNMTTSTATDESYAHENKILIHIYVVERIHFRVFYKFNRYKTGLYVPAEYAI